MEEEKQIEKEQPRKDIRLALLFIWKWFKRFSLLFIGLFLLLFLTFQIPAVQNWTANRLTTGIGQQLESKVELDYLYLSFFDKLSLRNFYIEDIYQDTLLFAEELVVDFDLNPISLLRNGLGIEAIRLNNTQLYQRRKTGDMTNSLQVAIQRLFPKKENKKKEKGGGLPLEVRYLSINDLTFVKDDEDRGQIHTIYLDGAQIDIKSLDFPNSHIELGTVKVRRPRVLLDDLDRGPNIEAVFAEDERLLRLADTLVFQPNYFYYSIDEFQIEGGYFALHNYRNAPEKLTPADQLDYKHMEVFDIDMEILHFVYFEEKYEGELRHMSFHDSSGFVLNDWQADYACLSPQQLEIEGMYFKTPYSVIRDKLSLSYNDFYDYTTFPDSVTMRIGFNESSIALRDIMVFAPSLRNNNFFSTNANEVLDIDGQIRGRVNNLRGRDLNIQLAGIGGNTTIRGRFDARNLTTPKGELISLNLEQLTTNMKTLRQLIPNFDPPRNFDQLGQLSFKGFFEGYFTNFVADGLLTSNIGAAKMDMQMQLPGGKSNATYKGNLSLIDFDLGRWSQDSTLGIVNFTSNVSDGRGLTGESASAKLTAAVQSFSYRGYKYENAAITGTLNRNFFDGNFNIRDDNIDLNFDGQLDFTDSIPNYIFKAAVTKLDLKKLNLSKKDLILGAKLDLDLKTNRISDMVGFADLRDVIILEDQEKEYRVDSLRIDSRVDVFGDNHVEVVSEILTADFNGKYDVEQLPNTLLYFVETHYPGFAGRLNIRGKIDSSQIANNFDFNIHIKDSKNLNQLISPTLGPIQNGLVEGYYRGGQEQMNLVVEFPSLQINKIDFRDLTFRFDADSGNASMSLVIDSTFINENTHFGQANLASILTSDTLDFALTYTQSNSYVEGLKIDGLLYLPDSQNYKIQFKPSNLQVLETKWDMSQDNYIVFGKNYLNTKNFKLMNGKRVVELNKEGAKEISLKVSNFDFAFIDEIWVYDPLDFRGEFNAEVFIGDVFELEDIRLSVAADTFLINERDFGGFQLQADAGNVKSPLNAYFSMTRDTMQMIGDGVINLANEGGKETEELTLEQQGGYYDFSIDFSGYPLDIAEFWIGESVSGMRGDFWSNLQINGKGEPNISGEILVYDGAVTVDFLQTEYTFDRGLVTVDNQLFDASRTVIYDKYGHSAEIKGGISHDHLRNLGLAASLHTDRFLALDTQKGDNDLFYGHALGSGDIFFNGDFRQPNIYINATAGDSTKITIPVSYDVETSPIDEIRFVSKHSKKEEDATSNPALIRGLSLEMDLGVTEEAEMELIFDEQAGDIIRGNGRGNIRVLLPRGRDFQMFGDYTIERGDYLFTLYNVVNKDFSIKRGGKITWDGDPFGARIKLEASYKDLKTSVSNFIQEYLSGVDSETKNAASNPTDVDLTLQLEGELLRPLINFDVAFPSLTGQLQTYTDNKLRLLKQNQDELNRQVFGLIVVQQFLPSGLAFNGGTVLYNTMSEFLSNQLSLLVTRLFSDQDIEFDFDYRKYNTTNLGEGQDLLGGDEFEVSVRKRINDRLSIEVGGNVDIGTVASSSSVGGNGTFVGNDIVIEYVINDARTLKLRVYQRLEPEIGGVRKLQVGAGLSYRRQFNTFNEFLKSLKRDADK